MSVSNPERVVTKQDLKDFYDNIRPYLGGSVAAGFTPVGTVISVMGVNAPANYLKCDGTVYNIADYPELSNYFYQQFGTKNKFGGNGTTTFAVPDLRGEFLRGTGTNGHSNEGSGSAVGTHQAATKIPFIGTYLENTAQANKIYFDIPQVSWTSGTNGTIVNSYDGVGRSAGSPTHYARWNADMTYESAANTGEVNVRPTNTSVLYCVATKNIYMNPSLDYSTDEKVVGTWITGATLYQKTLIGKMTEANADNLISIGASVEYAHVVQSCIFQENACIVLPTVTNNLDTYAKVFIRTNANTSTPNVLVLRTTNTGWLNIDVITTIQYTKTT